MTLKATQFRFQVAAVDGISVQTNITIDGVPLWSGSLTQTVSKVDVGQWKISDIPYSVAACEIDTPEVVDNNPTWLNRLFTISVTGGDIVLTGISQSNNPIFEKIPHPTLDPPFYVFYAGGNPDFSFQWDIVTQPLWDGQAILYRYNITKNLGITGPGCVLIKNGETCEFTAALFPYCPVIT
jgi:hypothetical protein